MVRRNSRLLLKLLLLVMLKPFFVFSLQVTCILELFIISYGFYDRIYHFPGAYIGDVNMLMDKSLRPLCKQCKSRPRAYAYRRGDRVYWRSLCDACNRKRAGKRVGGITALQRSGYKKKKKCEVCGFKAQDKEQLDVLFVDGDLRNISVGNLKTVCANCQRLQGIRRLGWRIGDLVADD